MKTFALLTCFSNEDCGKKYDFPKFHTNSDLYKILSYLLQLKIDASRIKVLTDIIPSETSIQTLYTSLSKFIPNLPKNIIDLHSYAKNADLLLRIIKSLKEDQITAFCALFLNISIIKSRKKYIDKVRNVTNKMKQNDRLIWYYSGHGEMDKKIGILVPNRKKETCSILETDELRHLIHNIPSSCEVLCLFDCCHAQVVTPTPDEGKGPKFISISSSKATQLSGFYHTSPYGSLFTHFLLRHLVERKPETFSSITSISKDINFHRARENKPKQTICFSTNTFGDKIPSWFLFEK